MSEASFDEIIQLDGEGRYDIFVSMVADEREVWVLMNGNNEFLKIYSDEHDLEYLPVWPHADFTQKHQQGAGEKLSAKSITIPEFFAKWVPGLERDGIQVGVFPGIGDDVMIMDASELKSDLQDEFTNFSL